MHDEQQRTLVEKF